VREAQGGGGSGASVAEVRAREQAAGAAAERSQWYHGEPQSGDGVALTQDMTFDGKTLRLFEPQTMTDAYMTPNRALIGEWPAVSGREGYQSPANQRVSRQGPIPAGDYLARQARLQSISSGDKTLGLIGRGEWPGGIRAWGDHRLWLEPLSGTDTFGRGGFSIHGGTSFGSAGCIDCAGGMNSFAGQFRLLNQDLTLRVQY